MIPIDKDFETVYPKLKNYAFYLTKANPEEAEDLLHDTCLRMLEKVEKFIYDPKNNYTVEKWGISVMHNLFIDRKRYSKTHGESISIDDFKGFVDLKDNSFKTNDKALISDKFRMIKRTIRKEIKEQKYSKSETSEQFLQIFIYRSFGLTYNEIADYMNLNVNTVKGRVMGMKRRLEKMINFG